MVSSTSWVDVKHRSQRGASPTEHACERVRVPYARNLGVSTSSLPERCITARRCAASRTASAHRIRTLATARTTSGDACVVGSWCRAPLLRLKRNCSSVPSPTTSAPRNSWLSGSDAAKRRSQAGERRGRVNDRLNDVRDFTSYRLGEMRNVGPAVGTSISTTPRLRTPSSTASFTMRTTSTCMGTASEKREHS